MDLSVNKPIKTVKHSESPIGRFTAYMEARRQIHKLPYRARRAAFDNLRRDYLNAAHAWVKQDRQRRGKPPRPNQDKSAQD